MFSILSLTVDQLRFAQRLFYIPTSFLKFINRFNYIFLSFGRNKLLVSNISFFDLSIQRMQYFIKYLGFKNIVFLGLVEALSDLLETRSLRDLCFLSILSIKPLFVLKKYRPGLFTNWRSNIIHLFTPKSYSKVKLKVLKKHILRKFMDKVSSKSSLIIDEDTIKVSKRFRKNSSVLPNRFINFKISKRCPFPSILLSLDSFRNLYLFAEAERLGLPVIGPSSLYLNSSFWTYSYPVFLHTDYIRSFFVRLFAINYLKGRLNYFFLDISY